MNPAVRPVLDLIDQAQRSNSISNLTSDDIASVIGPVSNGSYAQQSSSVHLNYTSDPELLDLIKQLNVTMQAATNAYQKPSPAYCWAEGKGGVNEAQSLISKIKQNAKR